MWAEPWACICTYTHAHIATLSHCVPTSIVYDFPLQTSSHTHSHRIPLLLMSVAYYQIVRVLWKSDTIPGHRESRSMVHTCGCTCAFYITFIQFAHSCNRAFYIRLVSRGAAQIYVRPDRRATPVQWDSYAPVARRPKCWWPSS